MQKFNDSDILFYFNILSLGIDKVKKNKNKFLEDIFKYINTDLICYRAEKPEDLVNLQNKYWDPVLKRLSFLDLKFKTFYGIMPQEQLKSTIKKFKNKLNKLNEIEIVCLLKLTQSIGSVLLSYSLSPKIHFFHKC